MHHLLFPAAFTGQELCFVVFPVLSLSLKKVAFHPLQTGGLCFRHCSQRYTLPQIVLLAQLMPVYNWLIALPCARTGSQVCVVSHLSIYSYLVYAKHIKSTRKTGIMWEGKLRYFYQREQLLYLRILGIYQFVIRAISL